MAGLVPTIPIQWARPCVAKRDARHKAGHDNFTPLMPAKAGIQTLRGGLKFWLPASAGTSGVNYLAVAGCKTVFSRLGRAKRGPGPIRRFLSRRCEQWVPAFAGTTSPTPP